MAICKFGELVVGVRGTVAGVTFSANRSGPYCRGWTRTPNPLSILQTNQRRYHQTIALYWPTLTQEQRDAWNDWADDPAQERTNPLGETYYLSGFQWFLLINQQLETAAYPIREDPPLWPAPAGPTLTALTLGAGAGVCQLTFPPGGFAAGCDAILFLALGRSTGASATPYRRRFLAAFAPPLVSPLVFTTQADTLFGWRTVGQRGFLSAHAQDPCGMRSSATTITGDVT